MGITFTGVHRPIGRAVTGFYSLDWALRRSKEIVGWPTRTFAELYGPTGIGKTTFSVSVLGIIAMALKMKGISCLSFENQDVNMIETALERAGFNGEWKWINATKAKTSDESMLGLLSDSLYEDYVGLLDTIASMSSIAEQSGDIGDANMGRRAFPMAQFARAVQKALIDSENKDTVLIATNHQYENMQTVGGAKTYTEPGGVVKKNISHLRIRMQVPWVEYISGGTGKKEARWEDGWVLQGKVDKNRAGGKNRIFQVFIVGGEGIHPGLTSMIDCLQLGIAEVQSGAKVAMDGDVFGSINKIVTNERDNSELFVPFQNRLKARMLSGDDEDEIIEEAEDEKPKKGKKKNDD